VFNTLILDDDPMDGSRSLRKRKTSDEDDQPAQRPIRKRRKASAPVSGLDIALVNDIPSSPDAARVHLSSELGADGAAEAESESDENDVSKPRTTRSRRTQKAGKPLTHIVDSQGVSLVVSFNLNPDKMDKILSSRPRKKRSDRRDKQRKVQATTPSVPEPEFSHYPAIQSSYASQFYLFPDDDEKEKKKPYGGILSEAEADTTKTFPMAIDRKKFEEARQKAEDDWRQRMAAQSAIAEQNKPASKATGPPSKIKSINFGGYEIDTWHAAPYPEEYSRNRVLYICEFCLKYMNSDYVAWRHKLKCPAKHPPGDEIYRDGKHSFFEVDGRKNPVYCQNLCLLAKLFLGSKTLYYDVEPFLFYVMTENDEYGCHFVGYFSKEKRPSSLNNVSCILVLPIYQRRGFGHMLIEFSYLLTRVERKTGSPEKPLSDMGLVSYRGYWRLIMCYRLLDQTGAISINDISERTGMTADDIVSALEGLRALVRDPHTKSYALRLDKVYYKDYVERYEAKNYPRIDADKLVWVPYVMGRGNLASYEEGPPLQTVAPREGDDEEEEVPEEGVQMAERATQLTNGDTDANLAGTLHENEVDPLTPVPPPSARAAVKPTLNRSPSRNNRSVSHPSTPKSASQTNDTSRATPIPAHRYEIYPPIPGQPAAKRRAGRPFNTRRRTTSGQGTPVKRIFQGNQFVRARHKAEAMKANAASAAKRNGEASPAGSIRRTRSKLGEVEIAADDAEEQSNGAGDVDGNEEEQGRGDTAEAEELEQMLLDQEAQAEAEAEANGDGGEYEDVGAEEEEDANEDAEGEDDEEMGDA